MYLPQPTLNCQGTCMSKFYVLEHFPSYWECRLLEPNTPKLAREKSSTGTRMRESW